MLKEDENFTAVVQQRPRDRIQGFAFSVGQWGGLLAIIPLRHGENANAVSSLCTIPLDASALDDVR